MLNVRAQILFDESLWQTLNRLSKTKKTSISNLVRIAVKETYMKTEELETRRKAIESILKHRPAPVKGKIDYKSLINYGRRY
jgi:hypothetical protein